MPPVLRGDAEMMQPEEGTEDHPAAASRKGLTSETDAACLPSQVEDW